MTFIEANVLWNILWIVPGYILLALSGAYIRKKRIGRIFANPSDARRFTDVSVTKRVIKHILLLTAAVLAVIAAARPAWGHEILPETAAGRDVIFVADVSKSMYADDVRPTRLEHEKWLMREIMKSFPADRFGLVAFAGTSFLVSPLTNDFSSLVSVVDSLNADTIPTGGTNIASALETALEAFKNGAEGDNRAVVLLSDGDEITGNAKKVISEFIELKIPLFIAGIGDSSNPSVIRIPNADGKLKS